MFWGVTIENGKKYSQIVEASYHLSMAALEPRTKPPPEGERYVSLMLEHMKTEFLLCNLEYNKTMQCPLDLMFKEGEEVTFYLQGQGTVHLTGFIVRDDFDEDDDDDDEEVEETAKPTKIISPKKAKLLDALEAASSGSDDDEWDPSAKPNAAGKRPLNGNDSKSKKAKRDEEKSPPKKLQALDKLNISQSKKSQLNDSKKFKAEPSDDDDEDDDSDEDDDLDDSDDDLDDSDNAIGMEDDDDNDDDDDDSDDEEKSNNWGTKVFGGVKNQKGGQTTPGQSQKKKQGQQSFHDKTPQTTPNQKQKTPQGGKGISQQQQSPQSGKKNQNQLNKSPNQAQAQNVKTPNQMNVSKKGPDNSFQQQTPGSKKKNKKQKNQQTPNTPNNQSNKIAQGEQPKTPSGGKLKKLPSGVQVEEVLEGKGPVAKPGKYVHVYYTGKLNNNKEFDSLTKGKPFGFRLGKGEVIKGWDLALDGMKVGGKRKLVIPPNMGYGNKSQGPIPPNSTLHFEVELKAVN